MTGIKVIGAGMPRTGTLTQKTALEALGFGPCYHMVDVLSDLGQASLWERALDGDGPWEEIFDGFNATVDWPGGYFYRELADHYPDAKVVLSVRDAAAWERSMRQTVWSVRHGESLIRLLSSAQACVNPSWAGFLNMIDRLLWEGEGTFAQNSDGPEQMIEAMHRHTATVQSVIPASGCSCGTSPRAGSRCASSSRCRSPTSPSRTSTIVVSSSTGSSTARWRACRSGAHARAPWRRSSPSGIRRRRGGRGACQGAAARALREARPRGSAAGPARRR